VQIKTGNTVEVVEREMRTKRNKQAKPARHRNTNKARKHMVAPDHWRIVSYVNAGYSCSLCR